MLTSYNSASSSKSFIEQHPRLTNHLALAGLTLTGCLIAAIFAAADQAILETLSVGTGYVGLLLIFASLLIGPINMLKVRKNPVNINLRRDVGIWAGIASLAHVAFSAALQLSWGDSLLGFFFYKNGTPKFNIFGISNFFGLVGALVVLFLLVLSNNYFLKRLKGKNWKNMQRFNYLLFAVALVHTFGQQANNERSSLLVLGVIALAIGVMVAQSIGFVVYRKREQQRRSTATAAKVPGVVKAAPAAHLQSGVASQTAPTYTAPVTSPRRSALPRLALYGMAGLLSLFVGYEIGEQGSQLVNSVANVNSSTTTTSNNSSNNPATTSNSSSSNTTDNSSNSSNSSSSTGVNSPSFSQPSVRTQHS